MAAVTILVFAVNVAIWIAMFLNWWRWWRQEKVERVLRALGDEPRFHAGGVIPVPGPIPPGPIIVVRAHAPLRK